MSLADNAPAARMKGGGASTMSNSGLSRLVLDYLKSRALPWRFLATPAIRAKKVAGRNRPRASS